jgi:MFS transporter, AAHS family, 4-hydroxybenzoate transporter
MERVSVPIDIGALLDEGAWTRYQKYLTVLAAIAVIFDGFDIQILGFAIPSLTREWGIARSAFAPVLALGLAGMSAGSPFAGYYGDRYGRRPALIGCLTLFGLATIATAFVHSVAALAVFRFLTGMGAGGALPNASALVAEFAPARRRAAAVKLTIVCVPLGGMLGGFIAAHVLPVWGWRALYGIGGMLPLVFALSLWAALPESPRFLAQCSSEWPYLERLLARMGRAVPDGSAFADRTERLAGTGRTGIRELLQAPLGHDTIGLWIAFFFCMSAVYLVFGWLPAMLTAQGLNVASASQGLAVHNLGGVFGVLLWAGLVTWLGSRGPLLSGALATAGSALAILLVPVQIQGGKTLLLLALGINGLLLNAVQTSMYALATHVYPTAVRASGARSQRRWGAWGRLLVRSWARSLLELGQVRIGARWRQR